MEEPLLLRLRRRLRFRLGLGLAVGFPVRGSWGDGLVLFFLVEEEEVEDVPGGVSMPSSEVHVDALVDRAVGRATGAGDENAGAEDIISCHSSCSGRAERNVDVGRYASSRSRASSLSFGMMMLLPVLPISSIIGNSRAISTSRSCCQVSSSRITPRRTPASSQSRDKVPPSHPGKWRLITGPPRAEDEFRLGYEMLMGRSPREERRRRSERVTARSWNVWAKSTESAVRVSALRMEGESSEEWCDGKIAVIVGLR